MEDIKLKTANIEKSEDINFHVADITKESIKEMYDYVTIIQTLEHFDNPFLIIDKLLKHVKKELVISTPYTKMYTGKINNGEHRYAFNEQTFKGKYNYSFFITKHIKSTNSECVFYKIEGERNEFIYDKKDIP